MSDSEYVPLSGLPVRVRLSRKRGWRMPPNTVKVSRPTKWGNPWSYADRRLACAAYRGWIERDPAGLRIAEDARRELAGKNLACWCPLDQPCHADILISVANASGQPRLAQKGTNEEK